VADLGPTTSRPVFLAELSRKVLVHQLHLLPHHPRLRSRLHLITLARVYILLESGLTHRPPNRYMVRFLFGWKYLAPSLLALSTPTVHIRHLSCISTIQEPGHAGLRVLVAVGHLVDIVAGP
jgi:hypothetical protein